MADQTPNRAYPKPVASHQLRDDVGPLRDALAAIDADMQSAHDKADTALSGIDILHTQKANAADVTSALATKANAVDVAQALDEKQNALESGENIKTINGQSILGPGNLEIASKFAEVASTPADDGQDLAAATVYTVGAATAYSRYLPNAPTVGDTIILSSPWGHFANGTFTLRRRNAAHTINGLAEDVTFNFPRAIIELRYSAANAWSLA